MNGRYLPRIADQKLQLLLATSGAVLIVGPKWCGKTRTAEEVAASILYLQDPDRTEEYILLAKSVPSMLLEGETTLNRRVANGSCSMGCSKICR